MCRLFISVSGSCRSCKKHRSQLLILQVSYLVSKARSAVKKLDRSHPEDELGSIRIRSKKHEIIVAPDFAAGHEYSLVVIQEPMTE